MLAIAASDGGVAGVAGVAGLVMCASWRCTGLCSVLDAGVAGPPSVGGPEPSECADVAENSGQHSIGPSSSESV